MGLINDLFVSDEESELEEKLKAGIILFNPEIYDDGVKIGTCLKEGQAVCFNVNKMDQEHRRRLVDFITGTVFGVDGSINKIDDNVFLAAPKSLQVEKEEEGE